MPYFILSSRAVERRWVEPAPEQGTHYYNASEIPPEWHQWLTGRRDDPPSAESVLQAEAARNALRQKAAALEDAEIGQKFRVHSLNATQVASVDRTRVLLLMLPPESA